MIETGQAHTWDSQSMVATQGLIRQNSQASCLHLIWGKHTSWLLPAYAPPTKGWSSTSCAVGVTKLFDKRESTWLFIFHEQQSPEFHKVIRPWENGAYRLEVFLFYRSLNLNLKHNFSHYTRGTGYLLELLVTKCPSWVLMSIMGTNPGIP